jgi:PAS domain S-box-containing protein
MRATTPELTSSFKEQQDTISRERTARTGGELMLDVQERLFLNQGRLVEFLDASPDGVLIHRELRYVYANPAALKLVGRKKDEVIGHSPFDLVPPRFRLFLAERIMQAYTTHAPMPEVEERLLHASGAEVPVEVVTIPVMFDAEVATLVHIRDITPRRLLEVRLRAADRLASAGLIASGVVHEITHPLANALQNLELLEQRVARDLGPASDEIRHLVSTVRDAVRRAARVAGEATVFTSAPRVRPSHVDIHQVLESTLAFLGPELRSRANVVRRYADVPRVMGNEARLAQVFLNLLTNAMHSLEYGSRCANDVTITTSTRGEALVIVEVEDTGIGIPPELQSSLFEPLFTTKPEGSDLGLALSKELLAKEGGEISIESVVGSGTTLTIALRAAPREAPRSERATRERSSGKCIMIVADDTRLAAVMKMILSAHHVTVVKSGHEALQRLHAGESYDLIICDLLIENIDGIDLHRRVRDEWPGLHSRMIFLTGDAFISRTQEFLATIPNRHVQKPFEPEALLDLVDDVFATFA